MMNQRKLECVSHFIRDVTNPVDRSLEALLSKLNLTGLIE